MRRNYDDGKPLPTTLTPAEVDEVKQWLADAHRRQEAKNAARRRREQPMERSAVIERNMAPRRIAREIRTMLTDDEPITSHANGHVMVWLKPHHDPVEARLEHPDATIHRIGKPVLVYDREAEEIHA